MELFWPNGDGGGNSGAIGVANLRGAVVASLPAELGAVIWTDTVTARRPPIITRSSSDPRPRSSRTTSSPGDVGALLRHFLREVGSGTRFLLRRRPTAPPRRVGGKFTRGRQLLEGHLADGSHADLEPGVCVLLSAFYV